jgi:hypothetical protein
MPVRYSPTSYSQFATQKSTADLSGTWIVFISGTMEVGETPVVTGGNYKESYQYYSRALVRIKQNPNVPGSYFMYTCGPGGARDTSITPSAASVTMPNFFYSTGSYNSYPMSIVDAVTLTNPAVVRDWGWYGNSGWAMSYNLSLTYKRISDDPFVSLAYLTDLNSAQVTESGCIYEAEGAYTATQNDQQVQGFNKSGIFYTATSYPVSSLINDLGSYSSLSYLWQMSNYYTEYSRNGILFTTKQSDTVAVSTTINANVTSNTVHAASFANPGRVDDIQLDLNP